MNWRNKNWLIKQYNLNQLSCREIAEIVGVSRQAIYKALKFYNIRCRPAATKKILSRTQLEKLYINERKSLAEIAKCTNTSKANISRSLKHYKISTRTPQEANKIYWSNPEYKLKMGKISKERHKNENYKTKISEALKTLWADPKSVFNSKEYKETRAVIRSNQPRISNIQHILYSILDDLNVEYLREDEGGSATRIGPYNFDCIIVTNHKKLLIECQGDYWHSLPSAKKNDKAKATFIERYHSDCELKYLWEHEFLNKDKIIKTVKYWLGITKLEIIDFKYEDVDIRKAPATEYKLLLSKYHYLPNAGRGGIVYGAYIKGDLIAVCIFSPPIRQNISQQWGLKDDKVKELSRFCIHPKFQEKNFGSWFISRCLKLLPKKIKMIVSYCDTTFNHNGALYKACNFTLDGEVNPDYWYSSSDGWVVHKKTLYGHAKKMKMTEREFADSKGYVRVYGKKKLRFTYRID